MEEWRRHFKELLEGEESKTQKVKEEGNVGREQKIQEGEQESQEGKEDITEPEVEAQIRKRN